MLVVFSYAQIYTLNVNKNTNKTSNRNPPRLFNYANEYWQIC